MDLLELDMPAQPHPYLARMARWTNGPEHAARRAELLPLLPPASGLSGAAYSLVGELPDRFDAVPLAYRVPVAALGAAMGLGDLSSQVADLCTAGAVSPELPDLARTSLLFQCRDAVAGLVLCSLADGTPPASTAPVLRTYRAGGVTVPLASAPYGAGTHACPGRAQALALADGLLRAFAGHRVLEVGPDEDRPNLRVPSRLVLAR